MNTKLHAKDRGFILGYILGKQPDSMLWLYRPHLKLNNISPKEYLDNGADIELVEKVFCDDFNTTLELPKFD